MMSPSTQRTAAGFLPLKHREFLMLLALSHGQRHGYALKQELHERTGGRVDLGPGTLYRTIRELQESGLIRESDERPEDDDPRRIYYEMTELGRRVLDAEARRLEVLVRDARAGQVAR
jgi:DNA-binding PadR family transcriptional regulator